MTYISQREALTLGIGVLLAILCGLLSQPLPVAVLLAGLVGLVLLVVFVFQPKWGVLLLVSLFGLGTYSNFGGTFSIYGIASLSVAAAWLMSSALAHRIELPHSRIAVFAVTFLLLSALSLAWASDVQRGITWLIPLAQGTLLALMIGVLFRSRRDIHLLIGTFVISTSFGVAWGAYQEYIFRTRGWQAYYESVTRGSGAITIGDSSRISGTFFNPASLATYALVALVFATYFSSGAARSRSIFVWLGLSGLFAWGVIATLSRAPILVLTLLTPILVWFFRNRLKIVLLIGVLIIPLIARFAPADLTSRLSTVTDFGASSKSSNDERVVILQAGLRLIADQPFLGIGYANFPVRIAEYMGTNQFNYEARDAHNFVLEVTAETGFVGLAVFGGMIFAAYSALLRSARASYTKEFDFVPRLAVTCMVALTCMLFVGLATPIRADRYLYFMLGLVMASEALHASHGEIALASNDATSKPSVVTSRLSLQMPPLET